MKVKAILKLEKYKIKLDPKKTTQKPKKKKEEKHLLKKKTKKKASIPFFNTPRPSFEHRKIRGFVARLNYERQKLRHMRCHSDSGWSWGLHHVLKKGTFHSGLAIDVMCAFWGSILCVFFPTSRFLAVYRHRLFLSGFVVMFQGDI